MKKIYTAHSKHNFYARKIISAFVLEQGEMPLNPFMNWEYFLDEMVEREKIYRANEELVRMSDEVWQFGAVSDGCLREILMAKKLGMPVRFFKAAGKMEGIVEIRDLGEVEVEEGVDLTGIL